MGLSPLDGTECSCNGRTESKTRKWKHRAGINDLRYTWGKSNYIKVQLLSNIYLFHVILTCV